MTKKWRQSGLTLVELMVAITLALLVLAAMSQAFVSTNRTRIELDKVGRQVENGRYAIELLKTDLKLAGYYGEFAGGAGIAVVSPADACAVGPLADLGWSGTTYPAHVRGFSNASPGACVVGRKAGTDVIVVRRVSTENTSVADAIAGANANNYYLQTSGCLAQGNVPVVARGSDGAGTFNRTRKDCTTESEVNRYLMHIYYVGSDAADAVPMLRRREFRLGAWQPAQDLVEGIEDMRIEYAVDSDVDGIHDQSGLSATAIAADCGASAGVCWENVVSATVYVLARNIEPTMRHVDDKTYRLGAASFTPTPADSFKRHVYSVTVPFVNPTGRRE